MERLAAEKGLAVEETGGDLTVAITAASPEEALAQLRLLTGLLAQKPWVPSTRRLTRSNQLAGIDSEE